MQHLSGCVFACVYLCEYMCMQLSQSVCHQEKAGNISKSYCKYKGTHTHTEFISVHDYILDACL